MSSAAFLWGSADAPRGSRLLREHSELSAYLADELGRALVETHQRTLPIGLFSIEVEHIFHAGDELARGPAGMHHMSLRQGLSPFSARQ